MSFGKPLQEALDTQTSSGVVGVECDRGHAEVDVIDADRLGVRIRRVKVTRPKEIDIPAEATTLPQRLRSLPDRVQPIEVAPELGGAIFRTKPGDIRDNEFFEVGITKPGDVEVKRYQARPGDGRIERDWTMTRDQLGRLLDELS